MYYKQARIPGGNIIRHDRDGLFAQTYTSVALSAYIVRMLEAAEVTSLCQPPHIYETNIVLPCHSMTVWKYTWLKSSDVCVSAVALC